MRNLILDRRSVRPQWLDDSFAFFDRTDIAGRNAEDAFARGLARQRCVQAQLVWSVSRKILIETHGLARMIVRIHDRTSQQDRTDWKQLVLKARDNPEIAAA